MYSPCEILTRPAQPVLSIRTRAAAVDLPKIIGDVYGQIMAYAIEQGDQPCEMPFVCYYNLDMQDLDMEIGFTVTRSVPGREPIQASEIPAGDYTACLYTGPYEKMEPAYNAMQTYINEIGREPTGVAYEFYLNGPDQVPPDQFQTQILLQLLP